MSNNKTKKRLQKKIRRQRNYLKSKNSNFKKDNVMESPFIMVENNVTDLIGSNYWETELAKKGFFYLSINAGAFRLLVPKKMMHLIPEFKTGEYCIISKGPSMESIHPFALELLFEDHTSCPYQLNLCAGQVDRNPSKTDVNKKHKLSIWTEGCNKVLEMDAYFRTVGKLPYMKPLDKNLKKGQLNNE
ncbi:MAG: hypothetical protein JEZ07_03435 [Phycisphaerae bacterium]|nr:hypothetical protein [Phycisphaerae bacterium]